MHDVYVKEMIGGGGGESSAKEFKGLVSESRMSTALGLEGLFRFQECLAIFFMNVEQFLIISVQRLVVDDEKSIVFGLPVFDSDCMLSGIKGMCCLQFGVLFVRNVVVL